MSTIQSIEKATRDTLSLASATAPPTDAFDDDDDDGLFGRLFGYVSYVQTVASIKCFASVALKNTKVLC